MFYEMNIDVVIGFMSHVFLAALQGIFSVSRSIMSLFED